jgi:hypothetical protein
MVKKHTKKFLIACLIITLGFTAYTSYRSLVPEVVLSKNITYYLPGQRNECLWVIQLNNNILNTLGSNSEIKIGIPKAQTMGYLAGRIEVGKDNTLILAFNPPGANVSKPPVVLTADYSEKQFPLDFIRFRWTQSSLVTVIIFKDRNSCLVSRIGK